MRVSKRLSHLFVGKKSIVEANHGSSSFGDNRVTMSPLESRNSSRSVSPKITELRFDQVVDCAIIPRIRSTIVTSKDYEETWSFPRYNSEEIYQIFLLLVDAIQDLTFDHYDIHPEQNGLHIYVRHASEKTMKRIESKNDELHAYVSSKLSIKERTPKLSIRRKSREHQSNSIFSRISLHGKH